MSAENQKRLESVKARLTIADVWGRTGCEGTVANHGLARCCFHEEKTPSLSIFADGKAFRCHGCGKQGDIIAFVRERLSCGFVEALTKCEEWAGTVPVKPVAAAVAAAKPVGVERVRRDSGSQGHWDVLAETRGISHEAIQAALTRGILSFGQYRGVACWFLDDRTRKNAQARRLDGRKFEGEKKALMLRGSQASWPIGLHEAVDAGECVDIVEGGPDMLAGLQMGLNPVGIMGAANRLPDEAVNVLREKRVRIFGQKDEPGQKAVMVWKGQLPHAQIWGWDQDCKDLNDLVKLGKGLEIRRLDSDEPEAVSEPTSEEEVGISSAELFEVNSLASDGGENKPFKVLGFDRGTYYYFPKKTQQVVTLTASEHTKNALLQLAPLEWWIETFPTPKGSFSVETAVDYMLGCAMKSGLFKVTRIRGRGCWIDVGRVVWNNGNKLVVDGVDVELDGLSTRYVYQLDEELGDIDVSSMTDEKCSKLVELMTLMNWKNAVEPHYVLGWLVCCVVGGVLSWRPHLQITGKAGSGKSWFAENVAFSLLGNCCIHAQSSTTEAGIRMTLKDDSLGVVFDEAEQNDERSTNRHQAVLDLARASSSESSAALIKGSASGDAVKFIPRSCFLFVSIGVPNFNAADASRITVCELSPFPDPQVAKERFAKIRALRAEVFRGSNGEEFRRRCIERAASIAQNAKIFSTAISMRMGDKRLGDQFGALLAGRFSLEENGNRVLCEDDAAEYANNFMLEESASEQKQADETSCFDHLLNSRITLDGGRQRTVDELIRDAMGTDGAAQVEAMQVLNRSGMAVVKGRFHVATKHPELSKIFKDTQWHNKHSRFLVRMPGGEHSTCRFVSKPQRSVTVPLEDRE
jgi:hypothetical protein